jgi:hypothetical protein
MNAVHPHTYHVVKAEQEHRLARMERRSSAMAANSADSRSDHEQRTHAAPVQRRKSLRTAAAAVATIILTLGVLVGGALANEPAPNSGGGGGSSRITLQ